MLVYFPLWHTPTPAVPCVLITPSLCHLGCLSALLCISESHSSYKSQREIPTSILKPFTIILVTGRLLYYLQHVVGTPILCLVL